MPDDETDTYVPLPKHDAKEVAQRLREDIRRFYAQLKDHDRRRLLVSDRPDWTEYKALDWAKQRHGIEEQLALARTYLQWLTGELWS